MESKTIGVIGLGLMGASLCKALGERGHRILGKDTDEHVQKYALLTGTVGEELTDEKVAECDYLFLAVYPGAAVETLRRLAPLIRPETVVCDLCGVKLAVCEPCFEIAKEHDFTFIGGHPMAGTQQWGFSHSRASMFKGGSMILTPDPATDIRALERAKAAFLEVGFADVVFTTPEDHDARIAFTSQLPHVISNAYVKSPRAVEHRGFSAGSYRDLSRVSKLNVEMWTELFLENADNLADEIELLSGNLLKYADALRKGNSEELSALLEDGRESKLIDK
jgi:prephenate dehydrogenase